MIQTARAPLDVARLLILGAACMVLAACPDPEERFVEFVERTEEFRRPPADLGESVLADLEGRHLLTAAVELNPGTPLFFDVRIETNYGDASTCPVEGCTMHMQVLPLVSPFLTAGQKAQCPPEFSPAGIAIGREVPPDRVANPQPIEIRDIPVRSDGSFVAPFPTLAVDSCANGISGRPIVARLVLNGVTRSADRFCGLLQGEVMEPLEANLTRSTFGAERIEDDPADLDPRPILTACPSDEN